MPTAARPTVRRACALVALCLVLLAGTVAPAAAVPADLPGAISHAGIQRTYLLHVPAGVDRPSGLVVNLHGAGQNGGIQMSVTNFNAVADRTGVAVVYPDGIDASWADGRGASIPDRQGVDDVGFLSALIEQVSRDYGIPPGRVFATGMSAGGFMASRLACDRADLVAAIAPVAGTLGSGVPCAPSRPVSVLQVHGTADPVVPFTGGPMVGRGGPSDVQAAPAAAQRWRDIDACPAPVTTTLGGGVTGSTATGCAAGTAVTFVQIDGGGHVWPTGNYDASAAVGQFFAAHGR